MIFSLNFLLKKIIHSEDLFIRLELGGVCWDRFLIQSKPERLKDSRQSKKEKDVLVIDVDPKKT